MKIALTFLGFIAVLALMACIPIYFWPMNSVSELAQMIAMLGGIMWLYIGILHRRVLGKAKQCLYDPKTGKIEWETVGIVFRWKYETEYHGKPSSTFRSDTRVRFAGRSRTKYYQRSEIDIRHYLTIAWLGWRKEELRIDRLLVCGYLFRIGPVAGHTPLGIKYSLKLGDDPAHFSLIDCLELKDQLRSFRDVFLEYECRVPSGRDVRELLAEAVSRTPQWGKSFYSGIIVHSLRVFFPGNLYPNLADLEDMLRQKGPPFIDDAISRNEAQIRMLKRLHL